MKTDITRFPPHWAKDAIAGPYGWHNPVTGELLVSVRSIKAEVGTNPYTVIEAEDIVMVEVKPAPIIDERVESVTVIAETEEVKPVIDEAEPTFAVIDETEEATQVIVESEQKEEEAPKRRGRPPKNAN